MHLQSLFSTTPLSPITRALSTLSTQSIMATPSLPVVRLPDHYFLTHNTECSICHSADRAAESSQAAQVAPTPIVQIAPTSIIQTEACAHVFHELCLYTWVNIQLAMRHATCPMCRHVLVNNPNTATMMLAEVRERLEDLEREVEELYEIMYEQMRRLGQLEGAQEGEAKEDVGEE